MKDLINNIKQFVVKKILLIILVLIFTISVILITGNSYKINKDFNKLDISNYDTLIIVAHPADETIWSSNILSKENCLVVCTTCISTSKSTREFVKNIKLTKDKYILLGYNEYNDDLINNFDKDFDNINNDIKNIINLKKWKNIITHNPNGEYGNNQHSIISEITTNNVSKKDTLYYFNKYYSKNTVYKYYNKAIPLTEKEVLIKNNLLKNYTSKTYIQSSFKHILYYEEIIPYKDWAGEKNEK